MVTNIGECTPKEWLDAARTWETELTRMPCQRDQLAAAVDELAIAVADLSKTIVRQAG